MSETRRNLMVGVFMVVGLAALATLIVLFGSGPTWLMQGRTYALNIRFPEVAGMRVGNLVTLRGLTVGRVAEISLSDPSNFDAGVNVLVSMQSEYRLPVGTRAVATEPVLGQGRPPIELLTGPNTADLLEPSATIEGRIVSAMDAIFPSGVVTTFQTAARQIGDAAEALTPVLEELRGLVERRDPRVVDQPGGQPGNLATVVARFDSSLKHFNDVLGDPDVKSQLRDSVANLHDMSARGTKLMEKLDLAAEDARGMLADGRKFIGNADEALGVTKDSVQTLSRRTTDTLDRLDLVLDNLGTATRAIAEGKGTVGQLVMDGKLYESLVLTSERLAQAVEDFRGLIAEWRQGKVRVAF